MMCKTFLWGNCRRLFGGRSVRFHVWDEWVRASDHSSRTMNDGLLWTTILGAYGLWVLCIVWCIPYLTYQGGTTGFSWSHWGKNGSFYVNIHLLGPNTEAKGMRWKECPSCYQYLLNSSEMASIQLLKTHEARVYCIPFEWKWCCIQEQCHGSFGCISHKMSGGSFDDYRK